MKAILTAPLTQKIIGWLLALYIKLVGLTMRWEVEGRERAAEVWNRPGGLIVNFWHGRLLFAPLIWPRKTHPVAILISMSRDGNTIAQFAHEFGVKTIRGSSSNAKKNKDKGALRAFRDMVAQLKSGQAMAITPDGPRGPRMRVASGTVRLAKAAKAPIIPYTWSSSNAIQFKSWDRMLLPVPFGRGVIIFGEPLELPETLDAEAMDTLHTDLEADLNAITRRADELCGRDPVEPA